MRGEPGPVDVQGSVTVWMLGLVFALVAVGGLAVDLGHTFSERRALAAAADAAALAGCNAVDEAWYRATGEVRLDSAEAEQRARRSLATQLDAAARRGARVVADVRSVRVELDGVAQLTLLRLVGGLTSLPIRVRAEAVPQVVA